MGGQRRYGSHLVEHGRLGNPSPSSRLGQDRINGTGAVCPHQHQFVGHGIDNANAPGVGIDQQRY